MAHVRTTCWTCGDVDLTVQDVTVVSFPNMTQYRFTCPRCRARVIKSCELRTGELLISSGCSQELIPFPIIQKLDLLTVSHDELIELHNLIMDDEKFQAELEKLK